MREGIERAKNWKGKTFGAITLSYFMDDQIDFGTWRLVKKGHDEVAFVDQLTRLAETRGSCCDKAIVLIGGESLLQDVTGRNRVEPWIEIAIVALTNEGVNVRRVSGLCDFLSYVDGVHLHSKHIEAWA